jgi:hypothetical protein
VLATVSDRRIFDGTNFSSEVLTSSDYYAFGMQMPGRTYSGDRYRFGFNGMETDDEISGSGNSYTAQFWQYDSRLGRRWNIDPKLHSSFSSYATFSLNPMINTDPYGDTVKTTQKGYDIINEGLYATLGQNSPFGYDSKKGTLTFDSNYDKSKFSQDQNTFIDEFKDVVVHKKTVTVEIVKFEDPLPIIGGASLKDLKWLGASTKCGRWVYIAENPQKMGKVINPNYDREDPTSDKLIDGWVDDMLMRGVAALHEVGGHSRLRFTSPQLTQANHDLLVEQFETSFRQFYQIGYYSSRRQIKRDGKRGVNVKNVKKGDKRFLGGVAQKH